MLEDPRATVTRFFGIDDVINGPRHSVLVLPWILRGQVTLDQEFAAVEELVAGNLLDYQRRQYELFHDVSKLGRILHGGWRLAKNVGIVRSFECLWADFVLSHAHRDQLGLVMVLHELGLFVPGSYENVNVASVFDPSTIGKQLLVFEHEPGVLFRKLAHLRKDKRRSLAKIPLSCWRQTVDRPARPVKTERSEASALPIGTDASHLFTAAPFVDLPRTRTTERKWFFDFGANHGQSLEYFALNVNDSSAWNYVVAEANPRLFPSIASVRERLRLTNFRFLPKAAWTHETSATSFYPSHKDVFMSGSSLLVNKSNVEQEKGFKVETFSVSQLLLQLVQTSDFVFLKLDVEGVEYAILDQLLMHGTISLVDLLAVKFHDKKVPEGLTDGPRLRTSLERLAVPVMSGWDATQTLGWDSDLFLLALERWQNQLALTRSFYASNQLNEAYGSLYNSQQKAPYKDVQEATNLRKINNTYAIKDDIHMLARWLQRRLPLRSGFAICHGTRRGDEQRWLREVLGTRYDVIGTEISVSARNFPHTIQWDYHDVQAKWVNSTDFIYSNTLDHSHSPSQAVRQWWSCVAPDGALVIEHTSAHVPPSRTDPYGARFGQYIRLVLDSCPGSELAAILASITPRGTARIGRYMIFMHGAYLDQLQLTRNESFF